ncbi:MAG: alpha/beta fold hydrolase, partial [Pseudomonadota bacterium]
MAMRRLGVLLSTAALLAASAAPAAVDRREAGALVMEDIPPIPAGIEERLRQYSNTRFARLAGWDPDGSGLYVTTRFGDTTQLHHVAKPGGARRQLTFFSEPLGATATAPTGADAGVVYSRDAGGGEFYQLYHFDPTTGASLLLTDGESRNGSPVWSNDGKRIAYYSTRRNGVDWDLYVGPVDDPDAARLVLDEGGTWFPMDFAAGDEELLVARYVSINESHFFVLDLESGALEPIAAPSTGDAKVSYDNAVFGATARQIYLTTDAGGEFLRLARFDRRDRSLHWITEGIPWNVDGLTVSDDGAQLAFTVNENGLSRLYLLDTDSDRYRTVDGLPVAVIYDLEFRADGKALAFTINGSRSPGDVYSLRLADSTLTRWTESEVGGLNTAALAEPELIHYETFDAVDGEPRRIPAFYYRPPAAKRKGGEPAPVIVVIHGGPEGQIRPYFFSSFHYYLNELGAAVIAPNVRGSAGYGKSYLKLDNGFKRKDSVKDIGALLEWIEAQPELDADRVAVSGGSYGGYMVLATMVDYNERVACGIDRVGISNCVTFLENTKDYRRDLRREEYGDE